MTCRHKSRDQATTCPLFRAHKADRIAPLHGPNEFTWQLTFEQEAVLGSIVNTDPLPAEVCDVFQPIHAIFGGDATAFALALFQLQAIGLIWIDAVSNLCGYTEEGRAHVVAELAECDTSIAQMRLSAQAQAPSTYRYPDSFIDRVQSCLAAHDARKAPVVTERVQ